jgi:pimeloyl-ACP methyl ester carboxylesterase
MPNFKRDGATIHFEESGSGFPVLLFAPGGMRSEIERWGSAPWDPRKELSGEFRVIAMDQRNAGRSRAPVRPGDGWEVYSADHVALLDHLRIDRCHLLGGCIGGSYSLGLIEAAPGRVAAAVLQQPIGLGADNRQVFYDLFDSWADEVRPREPGVEGSVWRAFRERMYGGEFVFSVTRDFVRRCTTPMLVLMGNDIYHPQETSREVVALAPNAALIERWKEPEHLPEAVRRVRSFLLDHTPSAEVRAVVPGS